MGLHTHEKLSSLKYSELQKIAKSMQLKCGRLKAEKLIKLILKEDQKNVEGDDIFNLDGPIDMLEETEPLEFADEDAVETKKMEEDTSEEPTRKSSGKKRNRRRKKKTKSVENLKIEDKPSIETEHIHNEKNKESPKKPGEIPRDSGKRLTRSNTFEIPNTESPTKDSPRKSTRLSRSNTFEMDKPASPTRKRKRSGTEENTTENSPSKSAKLTGQTSPRHQGRGVLKKIKSPDLLCNEKQTIEDLEDVEKGSTSSPARMSSKTSARKSLRGQLLASRLKKRVDRLSSSPRVEAKPSTSYPVMKKSPVKSTKKSPAKDEKKGIPRFVKYTLNMPDFSKIHAKNFNKMESVDDYVQRKKIAATPKTKTPFKPTVTSVKNIKTNFAAMAKENTPQIKNQPKGEWGRNKTSTDSPGSYKRRSQYRPKLVSEKKASQIPISKVAPRKENLKVLANRNPVVKSRAQHRDDQKVFLKGVRLNKRFDLQMAKRGINYKKEA